MSHGDLHKFLKLDPDRHTIRILPDSTDGVHPRFDKFYLDKERLNNFEPPLKLPVNNRLFMPVIDLERNEKMILSIGQAGRKALAEIIERYMAALEHDRLMRAQAEAARRFKRSKLFYGAKR